MTSLVYSPQTDPACVCSPVAGVQKVLTFDAFGMLDAGGALEDAACQFLFYLIVQIG